MPLIPVCALIKVFLLNQGLDRSMSSREDINGAETDPPGFRDEVSICVKLFNILMWSRVLLISFACQNYGLEFWIFLILNVKYLNFILFRFF